MATLLTKERNKKKSRELEQREMLTQDRPWSLGLVSDLSSLASVFVRDRKR